MDSGQSRPFNGFTLAQLKAKVAEIGDRASETMLAEIARREAVAAGDTSLMTQSERFTAMNKKQA